MEDALNSTRAAVEEGIVSGGGTALINVYKQVSELDLSDDEATGATLYYVHLKNQYVKSQKTQA